MADATPIVESRDGEFSFLLASDGHGGPLRVRKREAPFPDAAELETVLQAHRRALDGELETYGHGRAANSLAAVYICSGRLAEAWEALSEAESVFVDMINDSPTPDPPALLGLAATKYNACVLLRRARDQAADQAENLAHVEANRKVALEALNWIPEGSDNHGYRFMAAAINGLSS